MGRLIKALLGAFGLVHYQKPYKESATYDKFVESCQACIRPNEYVVSFILTCDITPEFMSGGISGATESGWQHALTCLWDCGRYKRKDEIVESQAVVEVNELAKYNRSDIQMAAFSVSLNWDEFRKLRDRLYSQLGKPYDIAEFLGYIRGIFKVIPNPKDLHVCSTLTTYGAHEIKHRWFGVYRNLRLLKKNQDWQECTPSDIWNGCYPQFSYRFSSFHF